MSDVIEAGSLSLYACRLSLDSVALLPPLPPYYPGQLEWERKEELLRAVLALYTRALCWERALEVAKDLATFYEARLPAPSKLAATLREMAALYEHILAPQTQPREAPAYFRLGLVVYPVERLYRMPLPIG